MTRFALNAIEPKNTLIPCHLEYHVNQVLNIPIQIQIQKFIDINCLQRTIYSAKPIMSRALQARVELKAKQLK